MLLDPYISLTKSLLKALETGGPRIRAAFFGAVVAATAAFLGVTLTQTKVLPADLGNVLSIASGVIAGFLTLGIASYQGIREEQAQQERIENVEEQVREHPEKPQLAWDLARTKLESYLDRNLAQVRSIYWLTLLVMIGGFVLILYGLFQAFQSPAKLPISIVASASGVLVSFIGGSFLLIYRSILAQSKEYVTVLERINAVGMAVQVISSIPDDQAELKHSTTAQLAKQLLGLYAAPNTQLSDTGGPNNSSKPAPLRDAA